MKNPILEFFGKRSRVKKKTQEVLNEYDQLIKEYMLIQEKKSELSSTKRRIVVAMVMHLIKMGHIKVNT